MVVEGDEVAWWEASSSDARGMAQRRAPCRSDGSRRSREGVVGYDEGRRQVTGTEQRWGGLTMVEEGAGAHGHGATWTSRHHDGLGTVHGQA